MNTTDRIVGVGAFEGWAIVELMGHRQRAGLVKEVEIAGGKMLRIDIPTDGGDVTEFYGSAAIYSLRPCTEEIARAMCAGLSDPRPVRPVAYREPRESLARLDAPSRYQPAEDDDPF